MLTSTKKNRVYLEYLQLYCNVNKNLDEMKHLHGRITCSV